MARLANSPDSKIVSDEHAMLDLSFVPAPLIRQCRNLIESYHDVHGYTCLPDMLWRAGLNPFIERHDVFRQQLRMASTTRSAKKSNRGFVEIASAILSLEILATSFAGWSAIHPVAGATALATLKQQAGSLPTPLMDFYLYPPKYVSTSAIAKLTPPQAHQANSLNSNRASWPIFTEGSELSTTLASLS